MVWTVRQVQRVENVEFRVVFAAVVGMLNASLCLLFLDIIGEIGEGLLSD
jgi:hypothetical protein